MDTTFEINIRWDVSSLPPLHSHQVVYLETFGLNKATEMYKEGYREGELVAYLNFDDSETPRTVQGWWSFSEEWQPGEAKIK